MRTALISDVHANLAALEAVLAEIDQRGVDRIVSLGDVVGYGPDPVECVDLVRARCEWSLMGNHDFAVLYEPTNFNAAAERAALWSRERIEHGTDRDSEIGRERMDFLNRLRVRVRMEPGVLCVHGSPRRPINEYLFRDDAVNNPAKMQAVFGRVDHCCLVGHTHVPGVMTDDPDFLSPEALQGRFAVEADRKCIINPGSVGQPRDGDPRASYAILETGDGLPVVEFFRCDYDIERTISRIREIADLDEWLGNRLREGR